MLILEPVIETFDTRDFACWPVAHPTDGLVCLSAEMTAAEIGVAVAAMVPREVAQDQEPVKLLRGVIGAQALIVSGGLRARDAETGVSIAPSCRCGLETWREWSSVLDGGAAMARALARTLGRARRRRCADLVRRRVGRGRSSLAP